MNHGLLGVGEVGSAHATLLKRRFKVWEKDIADVHLPDFQVDCLHVALNYHAMGEAKFRSVVTGWLDKLKPKYLSILSTVPPGITESFGPQAVHSTTRGLHPNLVSGLLNVPKHVGGPCAAAVARDFEKVGITCVTHATARTTEVAHILNNSAYGAALMFADEAATLCRLYGVDYYEAVMVYTQTHNDGFERLGHPRLRRSILLPPNGRLGGHCVQQGATLIPQADRGPIMEMLAAFNDRGRFGLYADAIADLARQGEDERPRVETGGGCVPDAPAPMGDGL